MTDQQAYEKIRAWFTRPNAVFGWDKETESCVYRGGYKALSRARCAVGCLIPSRRYHSDLEDCDPGIVAREIPELHGVNVSFLEQAQSVHDSLAFKGNEYLSDFIERLDRLAKNYKLEVVTNGNS